MANYNELAGYPKKELKTCSLALLTRWLLHVPNRCYCPKNLFWLFPIEDFAVFSLKFQKLCGATFLRTNLNFLCNDNSLVHFGSPPLSFLVHPSVRALLHCFLEHLRKCCQKLSQTLQDLYSGNIFIFLRHFIHPFQLSKL